MCFFSSMSLPLVNNSDFNRFTTELLTESTILMTVSKYINGNLDFGDLHHAEFEQTFKSLNIDYNNVYRARSERIMGNLKTAKKQNTGNLASTRRKAEYSTETMDDCRVSGKSLSTRRKLKGRKIEYFSDESFPVLPFIAPFLRFSYLYFFDSSSNIMILKWKK